jgi:hypothetical protein
MKLTLQQAEYIAAEFQFLKGLDFQHPKYGKCDIDFVEPYRRKNGSYSVMLKNNIYKPPCIPEIMGFIMPKYDLFAYLRENGILYDLEKYEVKVLPPSQGVYKRFEAPQEICYWENKFGMR